MSNLACPPFADAAFGPAVDTSCRGAFDFTLLFEQSILTLVPAVIFTLAFPPRIFYLLKRKTLTIDSVVRNAKLAATITLAVLQLALVVLWALEDVDRTVMTLPSAAVDLLVAVLLIALSRAEDQRSVSPSSLVLIYLIFTLLFDLPQTRTLWLQCNAVDIPAVFSAVVSLKVVLLFLEARQKRSYLPAEYGDLPPESTSGIINRSFLWWLNRLFYQGFRDLLPFDALFVLEPELTSEQLGGRIHEIWEKRRQPERRFEFPLAVCRAFWWPLLLATLPRLVLIGFTYAQPFLITRTLDLLNDKAGEIVKNIGYGLIGATILIYLGIAISKLHYDYRFYRFITMFRGASVSLIHSHTLELQAGIYDESAAVTLMGTDIDRIAASVTNLNECWARAIEVIIGIYLLARQLSWVCIMPIIVFLMSTSGSILISKKIGNRQKIWIDAVQQRISLTSSMLAEMKSVKMTGLSRLMASIIQDQRVRETHLMAGYRWCIVWLNVAANMPDALAPAFTFAVYAVQATLRGSASIGTTQAFTSLAIIQLLMTSTGILLSSIPTTVSSLGCFDRVQAFLVSPPWRDPRIVQSHGQKQSFDETNIHSLESTDKAATELKPHVQMSKRRLDPIAISIEEADIRPAPKTEILLRNINCKFSRNTLTAVVGSVASGKSTFLKAMLGEVPLDKGIISVSSMCIAYCAQTPWLPNATIREVILGPSGTVESFDEKWYQSTIHACALDYDLTMLENGDRTEIGSGSTVLSGGQKQRVALARAVYARSDIVLLDDVLNALDARTKKTLMDRLLGSTGLLRCTNSTIVLVTHDVSVLPYADKVLVLSDGRIKHDGTYEQFLRHDGIERLDHMQYTQHDEDSVQNHASPKTIPANVSKAHEHNDLTRSMGDFGVYRYYFNQFSWWKASLFFLGVTLNTFGIVFSQIWLKRWTDVDGGQIGLYISVYFVLALSHILGMFIYIWAMCVLIEPSTARKFHAILLRTVMRAPQHFFSATDNGTILNRFSQDMTLIEGQLPTGVMITISNLFMSLAGAALIATGSTYMVATVPFLIIAIWALQHVYLRTSRQLRLLDLEARSPVYSHFLETLSGLSTVRAFGWEQENIDMNSRLLDFSQRPYYLLYCVQRWLNLALDLIVAVEAAIVISLALELKSSTSAGLLGVSMNNVLSFNNSLTAMIAGWAMLETSLGSITRLKNLERDVKPEDQEDMPEPPTTWPEAGVIEFKDVNAAHTPSAVTLRDISLKIEAGQKVGICGRTGSGKSSLIGALLGLLEINSGTVSIDGVDITTISRDTVRERLITIPQDPLILIGSVRLNADPANIYDDAAVIQALTRVGLWAVLSERGGLDFEITTSSLSKGQQQLLALARALLKKGKILILDEPTSNIDAETDKMIQQVLREEFSECTILTVAHGLNTLTDCEVILVMDAGRLAEVGSPQELLTRNALFFRLAQSSGSRILEE